MCFIEYTYITCQFFFSFILILEHNKYSSELQSIEKEYRKGEYLYINLYTIAAPSFLSIYNLKLYVNYTMCVYSIQLLYTLAKIGIPSYRVHPKFHKLLYKDFILSFIHNCLNCKTLWEV